jgi:phosphoribosyl 1,2-cyclic phosphodiesterase
MQITFHGVRGSTPCDGDEIARYGGNTSCVSIDVPDHDPILFDLGTGLRYFGNAWPGKTPFIGTCLLSHLHWDHVQGLPFFTPILRDDARFTIYAPRQENDCTVADVIDKTICPPLFPIRVTDMPGSITFRDTANDEFEIGGVKVMSRLIPHVGRTCGYRVEWNGASVAYLSDHQQPGINNYGIADGARDLCSDVDVLIHDAQYTIDEFALKSTWGHCTVDYAVNLAAECGARTLALFHHDPMHDDDYIDRLVEMANAQGNQRGVTVIAAREGLTLAVGA